MNPSPEQISEWREESGDAWREDLEVMAKSKHENYVAGFLKARSAPFTPITADDVTDEMVAIYCHSDLSSRSDHIDMIVAAVNAYMGAKK
jgi:hypothetical protein